MANTTLAPGDEDLEALRVTQPLLHQPSEDGPEYDSYSWVILLDDLPLRSHPSEVDCHPEIGSYSRKCVAGLRRRWRERVLPLLCLVLMFLVIAQFLLQLPRLASYFLEPIRPDELPGFVTYGQSASLAGAEPSGCVYSQSPDLAEETTNDAVEAALASGCTSVEIDLWLQSRDILVGSDPKSLDQERTLQSVYLQQLDEKLDALNSHFNASDTAIGNKSGSDKTSVIGLFDEDPMQSFTLLLNIRPPARTMWPLLVAQLRALDEHGYLSYRNNVTEELILRPITIVFVEKEYQPPSWIARLSRFMAGKSRKWHFKRFEA
ncbi:hypothetical protein BJX64DRAFT_287900 [Aspergillus heterothallicus]